MENPVDNPGEKVHRSVDKSLTELVSFKISVPHVELAQLNNRTWAKFNRNFEKVKNDGADIHAYRDYMTYQWQVRGTMPQWFVQELLALARGELTLYYQSIQWSRKHPSNWNLKRANVKQKQYKKWHTERSFK